MTEAEMRARITQLEADLTLWQDAYRRLAEGMAKPLEQPWPYVPPPAKMPSLPPHFVAYACAFPNSDTGHTFSYAPVSVDGKIAYTPVIVTSTPPKGNEP